MMRRAGMLAAFALLTFASTAYAECAWARSTRCPEDWIPSIRWI
jgi:hypothetical protein